MRFWRRYLYLPVLLACGACSIFQPSDHFGAYPVSYDRLAGWDADNHAQALAVFNSSCPFLTQQVRPASAGSGLQVPRSVWQSLCADASRIPRGNSVAARQFFERRFVPYRITNNGSERGLFTGYYEPVLYGSYKKKGDYKYPVYKAPADLKTRTPYYTHAQIANGVLRNRGLELVWVDDPVMLFFMQIQGSGRVRIGKKTILVGYAGQNGRQYESLGKIMGDEGMLPKDQINFFTIRQWLYDHPKQAMALMQRNPSYVFFRKLDQSGPVGAVGAVLTPQRSLAVDNSYIPYGLPLFLDTTLPSANGAPDMPYRRMVIAQDTGGAIKGPIRGDVFFGPGDDAEFLAGYMKGHGGYSLLVPREITDQLK